MKATVERLAPLERQGLADFMVYVDGAYVGGANDWGNMDDTWHVFAADGSYRLPAGTPRAVVVRDILEQIPGCADLEIEWEDLR